MYGTFAVVTVLLMWIYLSGAIIIFGGCLCAAGAATDGGGRMTAPPDAEPPRS